MIVHKEPITKELLNSSIANFNYRRNVNFSGGYDCQVLANICSPELDQNVLMF